MSQSAVYSITHRESGREYIGFTSQKDVRHRWNAHMCAAGKSSMHISRALHKYGSRAFDFQVEAMLPTADEAKIAEMLLIATRKPAFNIGRGGDGNLSGLKRAPRSPEWCAKLSAAGKGVSRGPRDTSKARAASAELRRGKPNPQHSAFMTGRKKSEETRAKMSASQRARRAAEKARKS